MPNNEPMPEAFIRHKQTLLGLWRHVFIPVVPVGALVGWVMKKAGYGAYGPKYQPKAH